MTTPANPVSASPEVREYYDLLPPRDHSPGDIWSNLPTLGLLGASHAPGLVITPACDLENDKIETVTYLPIISVAEALTSNQYLEEFRKKAASTLTAAGFKSDCVESSLWTPPPIQQVSESRATLAAERASVPPNSDRHRQIMKAEQGLALVHSLADPAANAATRLAAARELLGAGELSARMQKAITNSLSSALHFLPADEQRPDWSALAEHSVVLFRYPITAPLPLFDLANDTAESDWHSAIQAIAPHFPIARHFQHLRPMKRLRLKPRFTADLITRYVAMFARLGSPDFSPETVSRYIAQIQRTP